MAALDRIVGISYDAHPIPGLRARETMQVQVVDDERHLDLAREIGEKERDALEHADHDERLPAVVPRYLPPEGAQPRLQLDR